MRLEKNILYIDNELEDENVDELIVTLSQDNLDRVEVNNSNLGASIIQALLCKKREVDISINVEELKKFFENVSYKTI